MIGLERLRDAAAELFGAIAHGLEESARAALAPEEVRRLRDDPVHAVGRSQRDLGNAHSLQAGAS